MKNITIQNTLNIGLKRDNQILSSKGLTPDPKGLTPYQEIPDTPG